MFYNYSQSICFSSGQLSLQPIIVTVFRIVMTVGDSYNCPQDSYEYLLQKKNKSSKNVTYRPRSIRGIFFFFFFFNILFVISKQFLRLKFNNTVSFKYFESDAGICTHNVQDDLSKQTHLVPTLVNFFLYSISLKTYFMSTLSVI